MFQSTTTTISMEGSFIKLNQIDRESEWEITIKILSGLKEAENTKCFIAFICCLLDNANNSSVQGGLTSSGGMISEVRSEEDCDGSSSSLQ